MLPPLKPLPMKDRVSMIFIQHGQIDVIDGAFVLVDQTGVRTHIPVGSVGFIHTGKPLSFVYDIADLFKFETVVPVAFHIAAKTTPNAEREVRLACRDIFRSTKLLARIIPAIEDVLTAGGIQPPEAPPESVASAIPNAESSGEVGHRVGGS